MKIKKTIMRLTRWMNADVKKQKKELDELHDLLKQLKRKEKDLTQRLAKTTNVEERDNIQMKLNVVQTQRAKGKEQLLILRQRRNPSLVIRAENKPTNDDPTSGAGA
jgi:uncharacterized protein YacL (UPF0231 family)